MGPVHSCASASQLSLTRALAPQTRVVCGVCARQLSKYGCPRCNRRTCSLVCYKAHSTACTELFARDNVTQAMQGMSPPAPLVTSRQGASLEWSSDNSLVLRRPQSGRRAATPVRGLVAPGV